VREIEKKIVEIERRNISKNKLNKQNKLQGQKESRRMYRLVNDIRKEFSPIHSAVQKF
jgi:hypothetical protein